jgi:hypothetical protein
MPAGGPTDRKPQGPRAAALRSLAAGVAAGCYLLLLAFAVLLATADRHFAVPVIVAGAAGTAASLGLLAANLGMRTRPPSTGIRWLTGACLLLAGLAALALVGLAIVNVAGNDLTAALLAAGFVVPLLGVAVPGIPTLTATMRR